MRLHYNKQDLQQVMDRIIDYTLQMDFGWNWPGGVAYYGITRAYEATGRQDYLSRLAARVDEYLEVGLPQMWIVNTCSMGHLLLTLHKELGDPQYLEIIRSKLAHLKNEAPRFGDGVLQHTVSENNDFPEQCWADTLFMAAYFMLRAGIALDDRALIEDALNQYYWHINYLQDPDTGLWYHAYNNLMQDHMSGFYWGRANAWAAYTMARVERILPEAYLYPPFMDIECSLRDQLAALKGLQASDGLWRTLADDPESYGEVSATAGIAAAMVTLGAPLHTKYVQRALEGVLANVAENGRVRNVSGGTAVMRDREGYRNVPNRWAQGWGQGLVLAFLAAVLEYAEPITTDNGEETE